jgi:hypothetical protein
MAIGYWSLVMDWTLVWSLTMITIVILAILFFLGWTAIKAVKLFETRFKSKEAVKEQELKIEQEKIELYKDAIDIDNPDSPLLLL